MFEKKYIMLILTFFSIFITLCMINETYAKYVSVATSTTTTSIARWKILINNDDVTLGSTSSTLITPVFPGSNDISSGVLAPNAEGYFELALDASNVDVSFQYTITINANVNSPVTELVATRYSIGNDPPVDFGESKTLTGIIRLNDANKTRNIKVYVKWDDSLNLMTNAQDTDTTVGSQVGMLDVSISAVQI